ncbi:hypothetical protein D3C81_1453580 [compost metagenome]
MTAARVLIPTHWVAGDHEAISDLVDPMVTLTDTIGRIEVGPLGVCRHTEVTVKDQCVVRQTSEHTTTSTQGHLGEDEPSIEVRCNEPHDSVRQHCRILRNYQLDNRWSDNGRWVVPAASDDRLFQGIQLRLGCRDTATGRHVSRHGQIA